MLGVMEDSPPVTPIGKYTADSIKHIYVENSTGTTAVFVPECYQVFNNEVVRMVGTLLVDGTNLGQCDIQGLTLFSNVSHNQDHVRGIYVVSASGRRLRVHGPSNIGSNILRDLAALFPCLPATQVHVEARSDI